MLNKMKQKKTNEKPIVAYCSTNRYTKCIKAKTKPKKSYRYRLKMGINPADNNEGFRASNEKMPADNNQGCETLLHQRRGAGYKPESCSVQYNC